MRRPWVWITISGLILAAIGIWWGSFGGQAWFATFTGTDYCVNLPARYTDVCRHYGYWSGFGSVMPWSLMGLGGILTGLGLMFRHTNCHEKGCWRIGKYQLAGGEFKVCRHHHPDLKGEHPTLAHMHMRHRQHKARIGVGNG